MYKVKLTNSYNNARETLSTHESISEALSHLRSEAENKIWNYEEYTEDDIEKCLSSQEFIYGPCRLFIEEEV